MAFYTMKCNFDYYNLWENWMPAWFYRLNFYKSLQINIRRRQAIKIYLFKILIKLIVSEYTLSALLKVRKTDQNT